MSLVNRPASPGDRLGWRRRADEGSEPCTPIWGPLSTETQDEVEPIPTVDRSEADASDLAAHRAEGARKALGYLSSSAGTPTYRRTRAFLAVCRAVERQALVAGLGHLHVGTTPCGPMCEPLPTHPTSTRSAS